MLAPGLICLELWTLFCRSCGPSTEFAPWDQVVLDFNSPPDDGDWQNLGGTFLDFHFTDELIEAYRRWRTSFFLKVSGILSSRPLLVSWTPNSILSSPTVLANHLTDGIVPTLPGFN